jgi:hypothetical protein
MSDVYAQESKFEIIAEVETNGEVFDHLVKVRHVLSGEEGLLLCSHYSRWPVELIAKATWLAGCFTPDAYVDDERLVFGAILNQTIGWKIDAKARTVVLSVGGFSSNAQAGRTRIVIGPDGTEEEVGMEVVPLIPQSFRGLDLTHKIRQAVLAADRALLPGDRSLCKYERMRIVSTFMHGHSRYVSGEWFYVAQALGLWQSEEHMNEGMDDAAILVDYQLDDYYTTYAAIKQTSVGQVQFHIENLNLQDDIDGSLENPYLAEHHQLVISSVFNSVRIPLCFQDEAWVVEPAYPPNPEALAYGYAVAVGIESYWSNRAPYFTGTRRESVRCHWVVIDEPDYGYARAVEIPNF